MRHAAAAEVGCLMRLLYYRLILQRKDAIKASERFGSKAEKVSMLRRIQENIHKRAADAVD